MCAVRTLRAYPLGTARASPDPSCRVVLVEPRPVTGTAHAGVRGRHELVGTAGAARVVSAPAATRLARDHRPGDRPVGAPAVVRGEQPHLAVLVERGHLAVAVVADRAAGRPDLDAATMFLPRSLLGVLCRGGVLPSLERIGVCDENPSSVLVEYQRRRITGRRRLVDRRSIWVPRRDACTRKYGEDDQGETSPDR